MERTHPTSGNRHDVIVRLRQQVADGAYQPPVDELVNRLVSVVMARPCRRRNPEVTPRKMPGAHGLVAVSGADPGVTHGRRDPGQEREGLRSRCGRRRTEHLAKLDRFANGFARAEVDFSEERNPRIADSQKCEVLVHVKGHLLKAHASAPEPFAALYAVCDKVEHQVKRLKDKRVARAHPKRVRTQRVEMPALDDDEEDQEEPRRPGS